MKREELCDLKEANGQIIKKEELTYIGSGENASVWCYEKERQKYAIKIFYKGKGKYALSYSVYKAMKSLEFKNVIKASSLLYKVEETTIVKENFSAYKMEYLEKASSTILNMEMSLLLKNIEALEKDAKLLIENKILAKDVKPANTLIDKKKILHIIDIDMFRIYNSYPIYLYQNYFTFIMLLKQIFLKEIMDMDMLLDSQKRKAVQNMGQIFYGIKEDAFASYLEERLEKEKNLKTYLLNRL